MHKDSLHQNDNNEHLNHCCEHCHDHNHGHGHSHEHSHGHNHEHNHGEGEEEETNILLLICCIIAFVIGFIANEMGMSWIKVSGVAYFGVILLLAGWGVFKEAAEGVIHGDFFNEFTLMALASIGAFCIGEYPEAAAVMLLYQVGEMLQDKAVNSARHSISALVNFRPDKAVVITDDKREERKPEDVNVGDVIEVKPGERVPLDGVLLSQEAAFNTAALTGESMPRQIETGKDVLAGMISTDSVVRLRVSRPSSESAVSRILNMVEEASERKAPTELFIHRFAKIYTPIVFGLAALVTILPWVYSLISSFDYEFAKWLYRSLVFLVISCPCALVISVPLGYFAGIGRASKQGILFKGSNFLDAITEVDTVIFDKTGTLTTGEFSVSRIEGLSDEDFLHVAEIEKASSHPIAKAIIKKAGIKANEGNTLEVTDIAGYGLQCGNWFIGTLRLLDKEGITYPASLTDIPETIVAVAENGVFKGYILLADTPKEDAKKAIDNLKTDTVMLSGDKQALVEKVAKEIGVGQCYGDLLPQGKVAHIENLKSASHKVAFVGDGINDAPVLALSDVGIAMGALGSDMAIETADVIIQTDQPSKVADAISIGKRTREIVNQNIYGSIAIKILIMILGVLGIANMWLAVFADTGVALLAVLNSMRVMLGKNE